MEACTDASPGEPASESAHLKISTSSDAWTAAGKLCAIALVLAALAVAYRAGSDGFVVLFSLLLLGGTLRLLNLINSVRWALRDGSAFVQRVESDRPKNSRDRLALIPESGYFAPFGAKSCRLYGLKSKWPTTWPVIDGFVDVIFRNTVLFMVFVAGTVSLGASESTNESLAMAAMSTIMCFWLIVYSLCLVAEGIMWYAIAHDYALVWGSIKFAALHLEERGRAFADAVGLIALLIFSILGISTAIASTAGHYPQQYTAFSQEHGLLGQLSRQIDATYYVLANMTTVGDSAIAPVESLARSQVALLMIMVILFAGFVISAVSTRISADNR